MFVRGSLVFEDRDAYDRYRDSDGMREHWADRDSGGAPKNRYREANEDQMSDRAESSGGASRGEHISQSSGGASRGGRIQPNVSGGASGY